MKPHRIPKRTPAALACLLAGAVGAMAVSAALAPRPASAQEDGGPHRAGRGGDDGREGPDVQGPRLPRGSNFIGDIVRDPKTGKLTVVTPKSEIHLCVDAKQDPACNASSLQSALNQVRPGGVLVIHPGDYRQAAYVRHNGTRIRALAGARLLGATVGGKGALVVRANDVTIEGLACSDIHVRDRNGACVRLEGWNLTLRRVHFFDSEQGVLSGKNPGRIVIEDSRFENLGQGGRAHGIYTGGGELVIRRSLFLSAKDEGHEIKSRAAHTLIEDSVIASLNGNDSYLIDVPNGGMAVIRRNVLQEGPESSNYGTIAFGMEGILHSRSQITIEENLILMDSRRGIIVKSRNNLAIFTRNIVVGGAGTYSFGAVNAACGQAENICVASRREGRRQAQAILPRIDGLDSILQQTGLFR